MNRFDVVLVNLDPTIGTGIKKTRPCVIISPNKVNKHLKTLIVAPLTSKGFLYPSRVKVKFNNLNGLVVLDQIRAVDKTRIVKVLGDIKENEKEITEKLIELFS